MRYGWDYEMSYGCRGVGGGAGAGAGGRLGECESTSGEAVAGGVGDAVHGSLMRTFHERLIDQDLRAQVDFGGAAVSALQQQIVYDKYLSEVSFLRQAREDSLPVAFQHHATPCPSSGLDPDIYLPVGLNGVDGRAALVGGIGASSPMASTIFGDGESGVMDHSNIHKLFEESLQPCLHDEGAASSMFTSASDQAVRRTCTTGMSTDCTFVPSYVLEASATSSQAVIDSLLLSPSPATAMVQVSCLTPRHSSSRNIGASISRSESLDHDGDLSFGTVTFHENSTQATDVRRDDQSALDPCEAHGDQTKGSELLGRKRVRESVETAKLLEVNEQHKRKQQFTSEMSGRWKRPMDQAEHIARERQRRDHMSSRFSMLETLLPPGTKRDRSTIVDDSIQYVKNLHHQISILRQKRSQLKLSVGAASSPSCLAVSAANRDNPCTTAAIFLAPAKSSGGNGNSTDKTPDRPVSKPTLHDDDAGQLPATLEEGPSLHMNPERQRRSSCKPPAVDNMVQAKVGSASECYKLDVFMDLPEQVVIEMAYQPRPRIQSQILQAVESLGLDVCHCSLNKIVRLRVVSVIVAKPRVVTNYAVSYDDIVDALKSALVGADNYTSPTNCTAKTETSCAS